jgi:CubicO group peptidase (beta-lactamase class C family)
MNRFVVPLTLAASALASACETSPDMEAVYQDRFATVMAGNFQPSYSPVESIAGAETFNPLPVSSEGDDGISAEALAAATDYAAQNNSSAFMVWHDGKLVAETYFGDVSPATPLVSKSLSKPLSAIAVGRAIQLGAIESLDQPVADFIPEWKGTKKAQMLVRHTLDMRSGFLGQGYSQDPDSPWNRAYLSPEHDDYLIHDYPMTDEPGSIYAYSNATADLVALVVERATGRRYADFVGQEVLAKIGAQGGDVWINRAGGLAHSGCCMHLPADSWLRLAILVHQDGVLGEVKLLPDGYAEEMRTATEENPYYGMGLWIAGDYIERRGFGAPDAPGPQVYHSEPYLDPELYLFDGNSNQVVYISPKYDLIAVRLGNTPPSSPEWDNTVIPNLLIRGMIAKK